ncbi:MAG TPA: PQQ-binding-like beta-propeller repeat protein [Chthoniobacteraceae bacterium]|nr:PQQ-binding-like beta-propeller repeat protein [Chthoniobacteraceae bacterium]
MVFLCWTLAALGGEQVTGWRGDGTGKFPDADPPLTWSRTSAAMAGLRFSAEKADAGTGMPDGVIREWLVAGPLPLIDQGAAGAITLPDEAALEPRAGEAAGETVWKRVPLDSGYLDFNRLLGKPEDSEAAALAFTRVFAPAGGKFRLNLTSVDKMTLWVNGKKPAQMGARMTVELAPGWNRLLLRTTPGDKDWYAVPVLHGQGSGEYTDTGLAWHTPLPGVMPAFYGGGMGTGSPVIVGENLYLLSEPHDLICLRRSDGKVQWIRRASYFEAASDAEKAHPAYADAAALAGKIDAINDSFIAGSATAAQLEEKGKLEVGLRKQMNLIDPARYAYQPTPDVGFSGFTPCTDGRFIYCWFGDGVSACFDLAGRRQWLRIDQHAAVEHGFSSSPILVGDKFVVFMRDLIAIDRGTGRTAWRTQIVVPQGFNPGNYFHGSPAATAIGETSVILLGNGQVVRAEDGKVVWEEKPINSSSVVSPVVEGKLTFHATHSNKDLMIRTLPEKFSEPLDLPAQTVVIDTSAFPKHYLPWHLSSPLVHEGLVYMVNNAGVLSVIEVAARKVVYQRLLDLDVFQGHNEGAARGVGISPTLVGRNVLLLGNNGGALVLEAGPRYHALAKNKIENVVMPGHWSERQERFISNPIAEGNRLYIRGEGGLYAIGAR